MPAGRPLAAGGALGRPLGLPLAALPLAALLLAACSVSSPGVSTSAGATPLPSRTHSATEPSTSEIAEICGETDPATPSDGVLVYFTCGTSPLAQPFPLVRPVSGSSTEELLTEALAELLAGPTAEERDRGWRSWFSSATADMLISATVTEGDAAVDFADFSQLIPNASTSAGRRQLLGELQSTVFQFPEISRLDLRIDGNCLDFWSWLGSLRCDLLERPPG